MRRRRIIGVLLMVCLFAGRRGRVDADRRGDGGDADVHERGDVHDPDRDGDDRGDGDGDSPDHHRAAA